MQENDLTSQYTNEPKLDQYDYKKIVNSNIEYAPHEGETWKEYSVRIKIYADLGAKKNRLTHIDGPRKSWWTHRSPSCFMCEDVNLISMMVRVLCEMASVNPDNKF